MAENLRRAVAFAAQFDMRIAIVSLGHLIGKAFDSVLYLLAAEFAAHQSFHGEYRVLRVRNRLPLCNLPDEALRPSL